MAVSARNPQWRRDLLAFGGLCTFWGAVLMLRVLTGDPLKPPAEPFQDVFLGVKFFGRTAQMTMIVQAVIYAVFGIGILMRQRWALIVALVYFAQVVIGHVIFFVTNLHVPAQAVHVKITAIGAPLMLAVLLYLWLRSRPLLFGE
jgi:hypothetical protein